ncbi:MULTISPECIES: hypothetical protein [unclassified Brevibacterium]|uniref:hypothetical protein n=1 Tax=unclassified Brevibacterium TaxID=2614124 RepID=UPI001091B0A8|nr:hypothetical protein [Brevibacterium sp. S22]TGD31981.1 hypothetical protein EB835_05685 [Brevibacterium sp. S22]
MPEQPDQAVPRDGDQPSERESESTHSGADETDAAKVDCGEERVDADASEARVDADADVAAQRRARLEAAKRRYRATLRNEADSGGGGFSEDYYRSQKPPHWS